MSERLTKAERDRWRTELEAEVERYRRVGVMSPVITMTCFEQEGSVVCVTGFVSTPNVGVMSFEPIVFRVTTEHGRLYPDADYYIDSDTVAERWNGHAVIRTDDLGFFSLRVEDVLSGSGRVVTLRARSPDYPGARDSTIRLTFE